jgi:integrase/recombinase XerD
MGGTVFCKSNGMKKLKLKEEKHILLESGFKEWLAVTGYAGSTVNSLPAHVKEFLSWLEESNRRIESITPQTLQSYFLYLEQRPRQRRAGALSNNYLLKHLQALKRLSEYLRDTDQESFDADIVITGDKRKIPEILSREEIKQLYEITEDTPMGLRDRAMLAVYYGCGLRRNEGISLDREDILTDKNLLYVRYGKGNKERYVPMTAEVKEDIESYLIYGRPFLVKEEYEQAFFLTERGERPEGESLYIRLKQLAEKAEIDKVVGLHMLRHTIATHLLENGMSLENIALFLGHESLESTQIYTHILNNDL